MPFLINQSAKMPKKLRNNIFFLIKFITFSVLSSLRCMTINISDVNRSHNHQLPMWKSALSDNNFIW